jgi:hypothetical protein
MVYMNCTDYHSSEIHHDQLQTYLVPLITKMYVQNHHELNFIKV